MLGTQLFAGLGVDADALHGAAFGEREVGPVVLECEVVPHHEVAHLPVELIRVVVPVEDRVELGEQSITLGV